MSTINLATVISFKPRATPESVDLISAPIKYGAEIKNGFVAYCGVKDSTEEIATLHATAKKNGEYSSTVSINVEVNAITQGPLTPEFFAECNYCDFSRISKALDNDFIRMWKTILRENNIDPETKSKDYWRHKNYLIEDPGYINDLMKLEAFSNKKLIIFPVKKDGSDFQYKRAALMDKSIIVNVECEAYPKVKVNIPNIGYEAERSQTLKMR